MTSFSNTNLAPVIPQSVRFNRLLQLCSANLPVGGFSFSQGLEYAVEMAWLKDASSTKQWIAFNLVEAIAQTDLAILKRLHSSLIEDDLGAFKQWDQHIIACRESYELHYADVAMGKALVRLLNQLDGIDCTPYQDILDAAMLTGGEISFVSAFALAAYLFELDLISTQSGFCWTYLDNQVAAATKLVPLGQTQAQNLLFELSDLVQQAIHTANNIEDDEIGANLPRLAMASAWHETQYSRLFRS